MLRKIAVTVVVLAALLIPLIAAAQSDRPSPQLVNVHFDSRPGFAEVRVNGVFVGTTPLPYRLTPGVHKIELSRSGFQPWTRELLVSGDTPTSVTAILEVTSARRSSARQRPPSAATPAR